MMRIEHRAIELAAREKDGTIPVTVSTETPVDRGDYFEVLGHREGEVDLSRGSLPLIESHDRNKVNIGIVEGMRLVSGALKAVARLGESDRARELLKDIKAGVVRYLSIGYQLLDEGTVVGERDSKPILRFRFMPYEISIVSVPADINAGFFRGATMTDATTNDERALTAERERVREIHAIATRFRDRVEKMDDLVTEALNGTTSINAFRELVWSKFEEGGSRALALAETQNAYPGASSDGSFLTPKERARFSLTRTIEYLLDPRMAKAAGFELEVCETAAKRLGRSVAPGRICVPHEVLGGPLPSGRRRDLMVGTPTGGAELVATHLLAGKFIDLLRNTSSVMTAGATVLPDLVGNVAIPRKTASVTGTWVSEGNAPSEGNITFDQATMTPKTCAAFVDFSRKIRLQATPGAEQIVRTDLATAIALAIDLAALSGSGTPPVPRGVMNTSSIGSVVGGTDGAAPTWDHMVNLDAAIANANAPAEGRCFITNSKVAGKLRRTQMFSSTNGETVWQAANEQIAPIIVSNQVPSNLTKGSSSGICSAIVYGAWAELLIGMWGALELMVDPYTFGTSGGVRIVALQDVDIAVRHPVSFAVMADALTT